MIFNTKPVDFEIPNLNAITFDNKRFYQVDDLWYPSVTTVTGFEKDEFFKKWRSSNIQNNKKYTEAIRRGNVLHESIENYLKNNTNHIKTLSFYDKVIFNLISKYLEKNIQNIYLQEKTLYSKKLKLAGRCDCIAEYNKEPAIIDFKGSSSIKNKTDIEHYFIQATCYALMWNEISKLQIEKIVILISTDDGVAQEFVENINNYKNLVTDKIDLFWRNYDFEQLQREIKQSIS